MTKSEAIAATTDLAAQAGRETNARLIAAAPELLAALLWAMRELGQRGVATAEYRNARAVIAKAIGK